MIVDTYEDWSHQSASNTPPADPSVVTVPTSGYATGGAPFGDDCEDYEDDIHVTTWTSQSGMWAKTTIETNGLSSVLVYGRIEQSLFLYVDGEYIGAVNRNNDSLVDARPFSIVIPRSKVKYGQHEIALLCLSHPGTEGSYLRVNIDYLYPMVTAIPKDTIKEKIDWATNVQEAIDGTENRIKLKEDPTHNYFCNYAIKSQESISNLWKDSDNYWLCPIWIDAQKISNIESGSTLSLDTTNYVFNNGELLLIWSTNEYQIIGIDEVSDGELYLTSVIQAFSSAWVVPARISRLIGSNDKQTDGYYSTLKLSYEVINNNSRDTDSPDQFLDDDIYTRPSDNVTSEKINKNIDVFDNSTGMVSFSSFWPYAKPSKSVKYICSTREEINEIRDFIYRREGKYRQFWFPSFGNDLTIYPGEYYTDKIIVADEGYAKNLTERTHIAIQSIDGNWDIRTITNIEVLSKGGYIANGYFQSGYVVIDSIVESILGQDYLRLTLNSAINLYDYLIKRISFLGLHRLASDSIELEYSAGIMTVKFNTIEISP